MANQLFALVDWLHLVMYPVVVRAVLQDHGLFCPSNWIRAPGGLSAPAPTSAPSKKILDFMDGMKLSPRAPFTWSWSVFFFFFSPSFSQLGFFSLAQFFSFWGQFFLSLFFSPTPDPKFFWGAPTFPPTYLLPFFLPTHLPPSSCQPLPTHLLLHSPPSLELPN
jgi:hypothetical protein